VLKLSLLREQVRIRKKVLGQTINITFTHLRKQKPLHTIIQEMSDFLDQNYHVNSKFLQDPNALVGKNISHQFKINDTETKWFKGTIVDYNRCTKKHTIKYDEEDDCCEFDLNIDLISGDLKILN